MKFAETLPRKVKIEENLWIPMPDGTQLAARLWLPEDACDHPVPALMEYIPYRKRDMTAMRDEIMHPWFAGHGYACLRVDLRGSGDSQGILKDEYLDQELEDGLNIIEWLASRPWCTGRVGIIGKSWGGFNGLQLAWLQPKALKAIITVCSTDDRYSDDVHYMGGCLLGDNLSWASTMFSYNSTPPDPRIVGEKWKQMWLDRLEHSGFWQETWLSHQTRDQYWRHGSICEDYSRVQCPVMAVSGWADGYSNAVFRLLENLEVPRLGLIGPWSHKYPHEGVPGPAIGFLQEALRWWDQWLKDEETGIMREPMLRAWMQDSMPPHTSYKERFGRWVGEPGWPSENIQTHIFRLGHKTIIPEYDADDRNRYPGEFYLQSPLSLGLFAGKWCSYSATPDLPHDQREEDGGALVFDSSVLHDQLEILGCPEVELTFSCDKPVAMICARLSDIAPDNKATRISYGLLNLCHRNSHSNPEYLEPGEKYTVRIKLNYLAQQLPPQHWFRLALSTSYFPLTWPAPESPRLTIYPDQSRLFLPVRRQQLPHDETIGFTQAEGCRSFPKEQIKEGEHNWIVTRDLAANTSSLHVIKDDGYWYQPHVDLILHDKALEWYNFQSDDYSSVTGETCWTKEFRREDWWIKTRTRTRLTSDKHNFYLRAELDAYENDTRVKSLNWDTSVPRKFV